MARGTFIQWYLVKDWTDAQWCSEYAYLKEVGMEYLVLAPNADGKNRVTYYPTKLPGYKQAEGYPDLVDACLRNAQKMGIKVFLGLNFHEDWWKKYANDPAWLQAQMQEGNAVADELYQSYHGKYPEAFYGWYWVWEVENLHFKTAKQMQTLAQALDLNVRHLKRLNERMPVMLCPFMNYRCGKPEKYQAMWTYVFAHCALGAGDIFCPQDCIGGNGLKMEDLAPWFAALRRAVETKPGLEFWSDTETFVAEDWTSATLDRFVAQLKGVQPYVDKSITFAYSHYYSPNNIDPGFHRTYLEYVWTGKLETTAPSAPANLKAEALPNGGIRLSWEPATDNIGVCGYYVYRNGRRIGRKQVQRKSNDKDYSPTSMVEVGLAPAATFAYEVQAYDFAGNVSPKVGSVSVTTAP